MRRLQRSTRIVALLLPLALLVSCGGGERPVDRAAREGVLLFANDAEPEDLDPHIVTGFTEMRDIAPFFEGLCNMDTQTLEPTPGAAASWTISPDGLTYTFILQPNGVWSNGDPVRAQDFVFSWQRLLTPALGAEYAYLMYCIKGAEAYHSGATEDFSTVGVKAIDDKTLEVLLLNPTPYFLTMQTHFCFFPVHPPTIEAFDAMARRGTKWTRPENLVGNGAFILEDWQPRAVIKARKNPSYWNAEHVALNGAEIYPITDEQTKERKFRNGEIHLATEVPLSKIDVYKQEMPDKLVTHPTFGTYFYRFNVTKPPFDDVRVRKAFAYAIDRDPICTRVLRSGQQPAYCLSPPGAAGYTCETRMPYDPALARQLLADAGYPNGEGLPPIEFLYNTRDKLRIVAEAIQQMWKENLNVEVSLINQEWKVYLASMSALDYQICSSAWYGDYYDAMNFLECFQTGGGNNRTGWSSPEYDALLAQAVATADLGERHRLYQAAEKVFIDAAPIAPIHFYVREVLIAPHIQGFHPNALSYVPLTELSLRLPDGGA